MASHFRLAECFYRVSHVFTLHEYSKLAYLTANYICVRELISSDVPTLFIPLPHKFTRIHSILSGDNSLFLLSQFNRELSVYIHENGFTHIKLHAQLPKKQNCHCQMYRWQQTLAVVITHSSEIELILIDLKDKSIITTAFLAGEFLHWQGRERGFMITFKKCVKYYEREMTDITEIASMDVQKVCHCNQAMIFCTANGISRWADGKAVQIDGTKNVVCLKGMQEGFLALCATKLKIYKQSNNYYEVSSEMALDPSIISIMSTAPLDLQLKLHLSQQEDILAFYFNDAIYYASLDDASHLHFKTIEHCTKDSVMAPDSNHSMIVLTIGTTIQIHSLLTYECYLKVDLTVEQPTLTRIQSAAIHPTQPIIAVALKSSIRIYHILYNELKLINEIHLVHCRHLCFNEFNGQWLSAMIHGKQGAKVYLYNNFQLADTFVANRKVQQLVWAPFGIYLLHEQGYYTYDLPTKVKGEVLVPSVKSKGAVLDGNDLLIWSDYDLLRLTNGKITEQAKTQSPINRVIIQGAQYILVLENGELQKGKSITAVTGVGFNVGSDGHPMQVTRVMDNVLIGVSADGNVACVEWGVEQKKRSEIVSIERSKIHKYQLEHRKYEDSIKLIQEKMTDTIQFLKQDFYRKETELATRFNKELNDREERYEAIKIERNKMEVAMEENIAAHEKETLLQVKDLQKIYERKIALTTNKLLTSEQIHYRNKITAENNLKMLQVQHGDDIVSIRREYAQAIVASCCEKEQFRQELLDIKKDYETKLSELEQENQFMLREFQQSTQHQIQSLKKNTVDLELKYTEAVSQKYNLSKEIEEDVLALDKLRTQNQSLENRCREEERRRANLATDYQRLEKVVAERDDTLQGLQRRLQDLEKSNQIFKYRIVEMKAQYEPKEIQIVKLKDSIGEVEEQYVKVVKKAQELDQHVSLLKKENLKLKETYNSVLLREARVSKSHLGMIDKVREAVKAPIQEVRAHLLQVLAFEGSGTGLGERGRSSSPLGELNRMREHLQVCLEEAVGASKKNETHKNEQIFKKNRENAELLKEINDLRKRVRDLEGEGKEKERRIASLLKGESTGPKQERQTTYESITKKSRESFFERSLFKQCHWNEKRLKTEQGNRRKQSSHSMVRNQSKDLAIESRSEDIDELKRIIEQKQSIIKQLINKVQRLS